MTQTLFEFSMTEETHTKYRVLAKDLESARRKLWQKIDGHNNLDVIRLEHTTCGEPEEDYVKQLKPKACLDQQSKDWLTRRLKRRKPKSQGSRPKVQNDKSKN